MTWEGGELVFVGGTDWATLGRSGSKSKKTNKDIQDERERQEKYPNLTEPHRLKPLLGIKIAFIGGGAAAVHCIAGTTDGVLYAWGRNEKGQLGLGDNMNRNEPTVVSALSGKQVVAGAGGRFHSIFVTKDGESFACGSNLQGQCGTGSLKSKNKVEETIVTPVRSLVDKCTAVSCGAEFTMWLCDGQLFAAGLPQYGQLGDGSDHEYNMKDSSIQLAYEPQPTPKLIAALAGKRIVKVACAHNHTVCLDDAGSCYTWGYGGYGRLGHKVQKDEFKPREVEFFKGRNTVPQGAIIAAGQTSSFCTAQGGQLFAWGKLKANGDNNMSPTPVYDLQGWNLRSMACGPGTFAVAADKSVITWGAATNGELGYGPLGKKSCANPDKCLALDNYHTEQVACGVGFTLCLVEPAEALLEKLPVYEAPPSEMTPGLAETTGSKPSGKGKAKAAPAEKAAASGKRKAPGGAGGAKAKKAK